MKTSESEEGPSNHKSQAHLGKLAHVCIYIYKKIKKNKWNSTVEYPNEKNKLSNK